ncbi:hypothetical protein [Pseudomonas fluorescens]|uniref:Uncharacterized protein n=1 Tax=Pseudomonas fluorescens TaxID=294 RepID=A0A5E7P230_PSEFL|nr:hypothetical protein [Pseudomonas fluorescens]VVP43369.1 hypothetical protein PS880_04964 [Pseudomonas fluorescens]
MKFLDLLKQNFKLSKAMEESMKSIFCNADETFSFKNSYVIKKTSNNYVDEVSIQKSIADTAGKTMPGYLNLLNELNKISPDTIISMRFIDSESWGGRVFFDENQVLIGVILGKKTKKDWKTPPDWDGSQEMIEKYNSH